MYEARKLANFVLARYDAVRFEITNLRLNKLLYLMHGWTLVREPTGLVRNHFEAWPLGPVLPSVYDEFKRYDDKPIQALAEYLNYSTGRRERILADDIAQRHRAIIEHVFNYYSSHSTSALVTLSHRPDGAWAAVLRESAGRPTGARIPNNLIRQDFLLITGPGRHH